MISDEMFRYFAKYIHKHSGINYNIDNAHGLEARLKNLTRMMDLESVEEVYKQFQRNVSDEMREMIIDLATNNETCFFRDRKPFMTMTETVIPEVMERNRHFKTIYIWSAACSTGQEPYSILMTLKDKCPALNGWSVYMHATDISPRVLEQAESGIYSQLQVQRGVPIMTLQKYFKPNGSKDTWVIRPELRTRVKFSRFNLLSGNYPVSQYTIIFCRNVLIYQDIHNKRKIAEKLYDALAPGGILFLGTGESMVNVNDNFIQKTTPNGTVFQKVSSFQS